MSEETWRRKFGSTAVHGYRLRVAFVERWLRFHALPESKRCAENQAENDIILQRANTLGTELFKRNGRVLALYSRPSDIWNDVAYNPDGLFDKSFDADGHFTFIDQLDEAADQTPWTTFYKSIVWQPDILDEIFLKIADNELSSFLLMSLETHEVLAPYDGGFDLILQSDARVHSLKDKWPNWLSARKDMM